MTITKKSTKLPQAEAIIHTTNLAGAGVTWIFAKQIENKFNKNNINDTLDLATIGTVADMVPLQRANRAIVKHGLKFLRKTQRIGLIRMFEEATIDPLEIDTHHINFIIAPRLNAMGRLEHAIDSLRLLCTRDSKRAKLLVRKVSSINRDRQQMTEAMLEKAKDIYKTQTLSEKDKLIIINHQDFHEGVIGLIAGKMTEEYYRPAIILAKGKKVSKASARSISGFNIIEAIRETENLLIDVGGHPMAAGFSIESNKIRPFKNKIQNIAKKQITEKILEKKLAVDCQIKLADINWSLYEEIKKLEPFGVGNPRPIFSLNDIKTLEAISVGKQGQHLKIILSSSIRTQSSIAALWFNQGQIQSKLKKHISLAGTLDENIWRNKRKLQLKIKDINY